MYSWPARFLALIFFGPVLGNFFTDEYPPTCEPGFSPAEIEARNEARWAKTGSLTSGSQSVTFAA